MFVLRKHLPLVVSASILAAHWTDHDPVLVISHSLLSKPQYSPWTMNDSLLSFKEALTDITQASVEYFWLNTGSVSSEALRSSHDIPLREHYSYLQIRYFLQGLIKFRPTPYTLTPFENFCRARPQTSGLISLIYSSIITSKKSPTRPYHLQWERELRKQLDPEDWQVMTFTISKCSKNVIFLENAYKVLYRWYYTPARLARFIPAYSPLCFRGCSQEGTMTHIWWTCQGYAGYGSEFTPSSETYSILTSKKIHTKHFSATQ
ncbi:hypothetical protein AB205_0182440 [Aquarana catesbeiana]|uniref:Uncharacterized protein n=1 Tax=Aquarana catesbeiana TaxID=8400 RepID=A0A2G9R7L1_AQUCT|nr:hypothetical protein AB205_0182440 [Aquarana catesbeiana]